MSFFEDMNKSILGANLSESYSSGMYYTFGDITDIDPKHGKREIRLPGSVYETSTRLNEPAFRTAIKDNTLTAGNKLGLATSGLFVMSGFLDNGFSGAAQSILQDIGTSNALARYGHSAIGSGAGRSVVYGKYFGQALMNKVPYVGAALNAGSYINKGLWANIGYGIGSSMMGNPTMGSVPGMYGAALGARFSGALTAGTVLAAGAGLVSYGAYSMLQEGLNHRQSQKSLQFAGDTSSFTTSAAATQRARAVQAMQKSHMNARSALGQEATYYSGRSSIRRY